MPSVTAIQTNFTAGAFSPLLFSRVELQKYRNGAQVLTNFIVQRYGGIKKRGGTQFIREVKASSHLVRLIPFVYSKTQAYVLEFGDNYIRFYTNGGQVQSGMSAVEVSTPWDETEIFDIQYAQSADVLYLVHPSYAPRKLERNSATSFTLSTVTFEDGPYLPLNETGTTLTPADYGALTPVMTSNTAPSGSVTGTGSGASMYQVFDKAPDTDNVWGSTTSGYVVYDRGAGNAAIVNAYYVRSTDNSQYVDQAPISWELQGSNNGSTWVTLDTRNKEVGWSGSEVRFYEFANETAYRYHSFRWYGVDGLNSTRFAEIGMNMAAASQTAFNLTASSTTGINNGQGFLSTDVGRHIRLLGSDGKWRWAVIQARTSSTVVTIKLYGHALPSLSPIINWQMGAWSEETGWPSCIAFYEGRLCFASTSEQPQTVWMSKVDDFTNFGTSDPIEDTDAINASISSEEINTIQWIAESSELFVGTTAALRTIGPNTSTGTFSPTNIRQKRETTYGASSVQPVRIGNVALYSGYYGKDLREAAYSYEANGYVSQDMSILAEHLLRGGIKQIAYAQTPVGVVWMVMDDGSLTAMTYERDQEVVAFHGHEIGGTSATVESVCAIPGTGRDEVWFVVKRTVNGFPKRYLERLSEGHENGGDIEDATHLDCHLSYSGSSTTTLSGLSHLNGESVYVWSDAGKQGPYTVSGGSITVGSAVTTACVGYLIASTMETLSPEAAAQGGTAQTRLGHTSEVFLRLLESQDGQVGPADGTLESVEYDDATLFTGDKRVPVAMEWDRGKRLKVYHNEPTPFHVLGVISELRVSG